MECKICSKPYGPQNLPYVLICGHTLCHICLGHIKENNCKCPFDRIDITLSSPNYQLMQLINFQNNSNIFLQDFNPHKAHELCPENHKLLLTDVTQGLIVKCNLCQKMNRRSSWHCSYCNYDICHLCKGEIVCPEHHLMVKRPRDTFKCDGCLKILVDEAVNCEKCDADLCKICCAKLKTLGIKEKFCGKGHEMKWRDNVNLIYQVISKKKHYVCMVCSRKFHKVGSFNCLDCKIDTCISCS